MRFALELRPARRAGPTSAIRAACGCNAELDLQIGLLAEQEITTLLKVVSDIAEKLDVPRARDPEITPLKQDVQPEKVLERIDDARQEEPKTK